MFRGSNADRRLRSREIDAVADAMPFGLRDLTRERIAKTNPLEPWFVLRLAGGLLEIRYPDTTPMRSPTSGAPASWKNREGAITKLTHAIKGNTLIQTTRNRRGSRKSTFILSADRDRLVLETLVSSSFLPRAVHYRTRYERAH